MPSIYNRNYTKSLCRRSKTLLSEWNEAKRLSNLEHGIDFADIDLVWSAPLLRAPANTTGGEQRWQATGRLEDGYVTAIYTHRGNAVRVISIRRARDGERQEYREVFGSRAG